MFIKSLSKDGKIRHHTLLKFLCDICGKIFNREKHYADCMKNNKIYQGRDHCYKCHQRVIHQRPAYIAKMKKVNAGINKGDKNGMKQPAARKKASETRKKMFRDHPELKKINANKISKAWADGKFDGVRVGQCKWYAYKHSNGQIYKVQGTWELAFVKWLDKQKLSFQCHKKWIPYILNNRSKHWLPDFYVDKWHSYIDVKCEHFYIKEKFDAIEKCNPDIKIKVLFKKDLDKLGVII